MLSSLPTELLRHIIESTVPPSFHSETYFDRLSTLRSLSLVSRRFRQIAQPLLVEIVWIKSLDDLPPIANPRDNRHLVLECYRFKSWSSIEKIKPSPSFEDASLKPTQMLEWSMIRNLTTDCFPLVFEVTRLTTLHLSLSCRTVHIPVDARFPSLESLSFERTVYQSKGLRRSGILELLENPESLPSLRIFSVYLNRVWDPETLEEFGALCESLSPLLPQLEAVVLSSALEQSSILGCLLPFLDKILFDVDDDYGINEDNVHLPLIRHLRLSESTYGDPIEVIQIFACLLDELDLSSVQSLYLPRSLQGPSLEQEEVTGYIEMLVNGGWVNDHVEVIWEDSTESHMKNRTSSEFWRRQRTALALSEGNE